MSKHEQKQFQLKRGKRSLGQFDVLVYYGDALIFRGSFIAKTATLRKIDKSVFDVFKASIENLNRELEK